MQDKSRISVQQQITQYTKNNLCRKHKTRYTKNTCTVSSFAQNTRKSAIQLKSNSPSVDMGIQPSESLPPGSNAPWPTWKTLNRLRSGVDRTKANLIKWGYHTGDPSCNCGTETQTMELLLQCPLLKIPCSRDDLSIFNDTAQKCMKLWQSTI